MFRKRFASKACAFAVWAVAASGAHAFEQTPLPPPAAAPAVAPQGVAPLSPPDLSLDEQAKPALTQEEKQRGLKVPGLGKITVPKLNFGLDLMYGSPESSNTDLGFTNDGLQDGDDLRIMGKMKRRF